VAELSVTTDGMAGEELASLILSMKKYRFHPRGVLPYEIELEK